MDDLLMLARLTNMDPSALARALERSPTPSREAPAATTHFKHEASDDDYNEDPRLGLAIFG